MTIDADLFDTEPVSVLRDVFQQNHGSSPAALLNALGACAGFAAQAAVWRELVMRRGRDPGEVFAILSLPERGARYYESDATDLFGFAMEPDRLSFLSIPAGTLAGAGPIPDVRNVARHVAHSFGSASFGVPRLPSFIAPVELPRDALARSWRAAADLLGDRRPAEWPALFGAAAYTIIRANAATLTPLLATRILLEAAVPMSRVDPATVDGAAIDAASFAADDTRAPRAGDPAALVAEAREAMPPLLPSLVKVLGGIYRPAIAFVNLGGAALAGLVAEDRAAIGKVFGADVRVATVPVTCDILFLYCGFAPGGRVTGEHATLRALIAETRARIAVVASELPARPPITADDFAAMTARHDHPPVNLVFTVSRKGAAFASFFRSLFARMWTGTSMPVAWEQLAPRTPSRHVDVPDTVRLLEAGHVAFHGPRP